MPQEGQTWEATSKQTEMQCREPDEEAGRTARMSRQSLVFFEPQSIAARSGCEFPGAVATVCEWNAAEA